MSVCLFDFLAFFHDNSHKTFQAFPLMLPPSPFLNNHHRYISGVNISISMLALLLMGLNHFPSLIFLGWIRRLQHSKGLRETVAIMTYLSFQCQRQVQGQVYLPGFDLHSSLWPSHRWLASGQGWTLRLVGPWSGGMSYWTSLQWEWNSIIRYEVLALHERYRALIIFCFQPWGVFIGKYFYFV